jgi:hypothetical protein
MFEGVREKLRLFPYPVFTNFLYTNDRQCPGMYQTLAGERLPTVSSDFPNPFPQILKIYEFI